MDNHRLTNKNSTYEEFEAAVYQILCDDFPGEEEAVKKAMDSEKEDGKHIWQYADGSSAGDTAWGIGLLVE